MTALIDEGLFAKTDDGVALVGSTCHACGTTTFPRQSSCPRCPSEQMDDRVLPRQGTLWSWTVQRFEPKPPYRGPQPFEPYGVGYVDLGGLVLVESRLTESDPARLRIGDEVELVLVPLPTDDSEVTTFAFARVEARA